MLDYRFIKENLGAVKDNVRRRDVTADPERVVALYDKRNVLLREEEALRYKKNENTKRMRSSADEEEKRSIVAEGKHLKERIQEVRDSLEKVIDTLQKAALLLPNMAHPEAPVGQEEKDNTEIRRGGSPPHFSFTPQDHLTLGEALGLIDFPSALRTSGSKFYYLKNQAVFLDLALVRYTLDLLSKKGFSVMITPDIAYEKIAEGIGFNPRGAESNIYTIAGTNLCLIGTSEITLGGHLADQIIDLSAGPRLLAGLSHCFRREAGAAGQYSRGLYRVHQFTKTEMFVFCRPHESDAMLDFLLAVEEEIFSNLGIPYRVVDTCTGDLGGAAYRKFDLEAWLPGRGERGGWGEITSASNCTDYQARRLKIRYRNETGKPQLVHTLNGTAMATSRGLIALLENHQQEDGSVLIPEKLIPYTGFTSIER